MADIFNTVGRIVTGTGSFNTLHEHAAGLGTRCLVVTGKKSMEKLGYTKQAEEMLNRAGIDAVMLNGIGHDPDIAMIEEARKIFRASGCNMALGLGGGSAIDAAKAIAKFSFADLPIAEYFDGAPLPQKCVPIIAIPSTFGTGTEVTKVSVLSDHTRKLKKGLRHWTMMPMLAIVDPLLGMNVSAYTTARSGMDAVTQAIESFFSRHSTDITEALSFNATVLLANALPKAFANPNDVEARSDCANGSLMAGMAFSNSRLGVVHGLAHPLGVRYGLEHGEVCAIILPEALRFNREAVPQKYQLISSILGVDAAEWVEQKLQEFDIKPGLGHIGIPESDFAEIAAETLPSGSTGANPRTVNAEDVVNMLKILCSK